MTDAAGALQTLSFLTRSRSRAHVLMELLSAGSLSRQAFRDRLSTSRSTVTRTLSALEDCGWIVRDGEIYRLTASGRIVAQTITDAVETVETTDELSTFLEWFPYAEHDVDIDDLRGADITVSTDANPYAPSRAHAKAVSEAATVKMALPSIDLELAKSMDDRLKSGELSVESLIPSRIQPTLVSDEFATVLRDQVEAGNMTIVLSETVPPFYVGLLDGDTVQIGVEDDDGHPRALLESTHDSLCEWGESLYASYRDDARELPVDAL